MITVQNKEDLKYGTTVDLSTIICFKCGVPFAIPALLKNHFQSSQETFYCPNGHGQIYSETTETRLRRQLEKQKQEQEAQARRLEAETTAWRNNWRKAVDEKKKVSRKLKQTEKRLANGTCPCCARTFTNMQEHMETVHPDFVQSNLNKPLPLKSKRKAKGI